MYLMIMWSLIFGFYLLLELELSNRNFKLFLKICITKDDFSNSTTKITLKKL